LGGVPAALSVVLGLVAGLAGLTPMWRTILLLARLGNGTLVEEPRLAQRFGENYREYTRNVPRWFPRRRPWTPATAVARCARG
jgi:protein-S-isoprenylcysteine O-methyltransferase Ste14